MRLASRILPGGLHEANRCSCDWGWQGFIAYGCQNFVVVVDPSTMQVIQTLHYYSTPVVKVRWMKQNYYHDIHSPYDLVLASANQNGQVIIWDVKEAKILNELSEQGKQVTEMEWVKHYDICQDLLMVLHYPGSLALWNTSTGVRLWKKNFQDTLVTFALDPFDGTTLAVMSQEWIMFLKDFSTTAPPSDKGKKFFMTSAGVPANPTNVPSKTFSTKTQPRSAIQKVRSWAGDMRGRSEDESYNTCDCMQIAFLPSAKNNFLLLFSRDILVLDLELGQTIGSFAIENSSPSFLAAIPCSQRDALLCLHDNGSVTVRMRRAPDKIPYQVDKNNPNDGMSSRVTADILYDPRCQSDVFRISRSSRLMGFCMNPISEKEVAVILNDGKIFMWKLVAPTLLGTPQLSARLADPLCSVVSQPVKQRFNSKGVHELSLLLSPFLFMEEKTEKTTRRLKLLLNGVFEAVAHGPCCVKMCPPLTTKNWAFYKLLLAVGCSTGVVQIYNLADGSLSKEYAMHGTAVKGIEWISLTALLSFAHSSSGSAKSEIQMLDIKTGHTVALPTSRGLQDSQVADLKVSHRKQYLLILFKNHKAELWDAVTLSQLREFPANFPSLTAFEWSPSQYSTKFKKRQAVKAEDVPAILGSEVAPNILSNKNAMYSKTPQAHTKEHLVYTDTDGVVYHYVVEGTTLKDGSKVPPESGMGTVSYITWKADMLVLGDVDGNLNLWDLKARMSRVFPSHRSVIKRLKFAPGKGNMRLLVLYNDGIDIWDTSESTVVHTLKTQKDQSTIVDADWMGSDMPLLLISDGSIRILDPALKSANSTMSSKDTRDFLFSPRMLEKEDALYLKSVLQHQPWRNDYSLEPVDLFGETEDHKGLKAMLSNIPNWQKALLSNTTCGTAERCKLVAKIFGDESDLVFWSVALHYLQREQLRNSCQRHKNGTYKRSAAGGLSEPVIHKSGSSHTLDLDSLSDIIESEQPSPDLDSTDCTCLKTSLDAAFDVLCDNEYFQKFQLYRIALRDSRRVSTEQTRACAEKLTMIGETDRAVQLLLETDPGDPGLYCDGLRACLIATVRSSGASQSTIKLVATNLIANGKLSEGVELLCLVDKAADACRYLQTYGNWELATWLAKVSLCQLESNKVLTRWAEYLLSTVVNQKNKAVLVLLSIGSFLRVLEVLFSLGQVDRAVLLYEACVEFGLLDSTDETNAILFENIILEYARLQLKLRNMDAFRYYCGKAGGRGKKLLEESRKDAVL